MRIGLGGRVRGLGQMVRVKVRCWVMFIYDVTKI